MGPANYPMDVSNGINQNKINQVVFKVCPDIYKCNLSADISDMMMLFINCTNSVILDMFCSFCSSNSWKLSRIVLNQQI